VPRLEKTPEATFGQRLRAFRVARGLTQRVAARKLKLGIYALSVSERGSAEPL
jgi:transcriptional regulator with XRE-family HTH domain